MYKLFFCFKQLHHLQELFLQMQDGLVIASPQSWVLFSTFTFVCSCFLSHQNTSVLAITNTPPTIVALEEEPGLRTGVSPQVVH